MSIITSLEHFQRYPQLVYTLYNIKHNMENNKYDYPLIICGDTGNGKSMLALHIIELWYKVILQRDDYGSAYIKHIRNTRETWIRNYQEIEALDINCNDEASDGLLGKESNQKFAVQVHKLFNVNRKKLIFSILLIPDFFDLPLFIRKRIRGLIYVNKRGRFKYYTKYQIKWINALNENKHFKNVEKTRCFFTGTFPDYNGCLKEPYNQMAQDSADIILKDILSEMRSNISTFDAHIDDIRDMIVAGKSHKEIYQTLNISPNIVSKARNVLKYEGKI